MNDTLYIFDFKDEIAFDRAIKALKHETIFEKNKINIGIQEDKKTIVFKDKKLADKMDLLFKDIGISWYKREEEKINPSLKCASLPDLIKAIIKSISKYAPNENLKDTILKDPELIKSINNDPEVRKKMQEQNFKNPMASKILKIDNIPKETKDKLYKWLDLNMKNLNEKERYSLLGFFINKINITQLINNFSEKYVEDLKKMFIE